jgi:hypothetical protein
MNGLRYQVPEDILILDFWGRLQGRRFVDYAASSGRRVADSDMTSVLESGSEPPHHPAKPKPQPKPQHVLVGLLMMTMTTSPPPSVLPIQVQSPHRSLRWRMARNMGLPLPRFLSLQRRWSRQRLGNSSCCPLLPMTLAKSLPVIEELSFTDLNSN